MHLYSQNHANYMANIGILSHDNFNYMNSKLGAIA